MCRQSTYRVVGVDIDVGPAAAGVRPHLSLVLLRAALTAHLAAVLCQPVLAGFFLTGDVDAIEVHATVGHVVGVLGLVVIAMTAAYVLRGRGSRWVLAVGVVLFLADGLQIHLGYQRALEIHIPLGVLIVVASVVLAGWGWSPSATRPLR